MEGNPEKRQDRVEDLFAHFQNWGDGLFAQQRIIYNNLAKIVTGLRVLEAGCGTGLGTAIVEREATQIVGTDCTSRNIDFARCLYPWIQFEVWDILEPYPTSTPIVIAVEVVEHVVAIDTALKNLLGAATTKLYFSTPNGYGKPFPPDNQYHVKEYTTHEIMDLLAGYNVLIRDYQSWERLPLDTKADPLVYEVSIL